MNFLNQTQAVEVGDKYRVITTETILDQFKSRGFEVTSSRAVKPRNKAHEGFQKHMIRLSHPDFANALLDTRPEIILINSYNGTTALNMFLGAYRFACANGLMVGTNFGGQNVRHVGNVEQRIDTALTKLVAEVPRLVSSIETMQAIAPSQTEIIEFINKSIDLVVPENGKKFEVSLQSQVLRSEDANLNAYNVFNIVQELVTRRGVKYISEKGLYTRTRTIKSVSRQVDVNRELWDLASNLLTNGKAA